MGTLEAVQALQVQNGHLQKAREGYHAKCTELERLRKEGAPQKEQEKVCFSLVNILCSYVLFIMFKNSDTAISRNIG